MAAQGLLVPIELNNLSDLQTNEKNHTEIVNDAALSCLEQIPPFQQHKTPFIAHLHFHLPIC
jgi:hypothetical protein